jgi:hypothetical protein
VRQSLERVGSARDPHGSEGEDEEGVLKYVFHGNNVKKSFFKDVVQLTR